MKAGLLAQEPATVVPQVEAVPVDAGKASELNAGGANDVPVLTSEAPMEVEGRIMHGVQLNRPLRDVAWAALFVMAVIAAFGLGTATVSKVNLAASTLKNCQDFTKSTEYTSHQISLTPSGDFSPDGNTAATGADSNTAATGADSNSLALQTAQLLCFICGVAVVISALFLLGLEKQARTITWVSVTMWPSLLALLGLNIVQKTGDPYGYLVVLMGVLWACVVYARREAVELTSELLRMSATAFKQNLGLVMTTAFPNIAVYILVLSPLFGMFSVSLSPQQAALMLAGCGDCNFETPASGDPQMGDQPQYGGPPPPPGYNYPSTPTAHSSDPTTWADLAGKCGDDADPGLPNQAIWVTLLLVIVWAKMLSRDIITCTVGGCIGLHYFETPFGGGSRALQGLKWSITSSFGSLCYSSFIMTVVAIIDAFLRRMREEANSGNNILLKIVMAIVMCLWGYLEAYLKFLSKMAVISLAITGEEFCPSAKKVQTMLWRNNLDGILVDSFGSVALWSFSFIVSVAVGFATWAVYGSDEFVSVLMGWLAGVCTFLMLMAIAGIVLLVSDTHYLCYILDLDHEHTPQPRTEHIHGLYQRAIGNRIRFLRANPKKWAATGPGKREKASGTQIAYAF